MKMLQVLFFLALVGCATVAPEDKYKKEILKYGDSVWAHESVTVPLVEFWATSAGIANKYDRRPEEKLFLMMRDEAEHKQRDQPNNYENFARRFLAGDSRLFSEANEYFIARDSEKRCSSFGYAIGTPDFNKCVFDTRLKLFELSLQQDRLMLEALKRPQVLYPLPMASQTSCTTSGNQTNCITR